MEKASALVRFDYADRYFLLSHLKRFGRRVCQILLGPIMWSCYVLRLSPNLDFTETKLEAAIITQIQKFLLELGKGYAFVDRQQHIATDAGDFYIDLVFYNYILKCFLLIDLKTTRITHQDVGQMDMYVRMYDELKCGPDDNPTIGLILCADTSKDIAKYSILRDNKQLFAAKYLTYLPSEEELRREIERQKEIFQLQHSEVK